MNIDNKITDFFIMLGNIWNKVHSKLFEKSYVYFVFYSLGKGNNSGFGNCYVTRNHKIKTAEDIDSIKILIRDKLNNGYNVVVVSWVLLKGMGNYPNPLELENK